MPLGSPTCLTCHIQQTEPTSESHGADTSGDAHAQHIGGGRTSLRLTNLDIMVVVIILDTSRHVLRRVCV